MKTILILLLPVSLWAWGSQSLDGWILGTNEPEVSSDRLLHDGSSGSSIYVPVGTSPFYYEVEEEGEGSVTMWIYDPAKCLEYPNPGYPNGGPMWGLKNSNGDAVCVGIERANYVAGCQGFSAWCSYSPYSYLWFYDGVRGAQNFPYTPGWCKWEIVGNSDDIIFVMYDMIYDDKCPDYYDCEEPWYYRDLAITYNVASQGGSWESVFGNGWIGVWFRGDGAGGVEDISIDIISGTGIFSGINGTSTAQGYQDAGWHELKQLFR